MERRDHPIHCRDLAVGYDGEPVLCDLSFSVESGTTLALVGRSGCGKTTLLKTLAGALKPLDGEATVLDTELPGAPPAGTVGYIPQSLGLVDHESVLTNVLHGRLSELGRIDSLLGRFPADAKADAREAIAQVGLGGYERSRVNELSGGQRRRVAIARAFVQEPQVLLADEMLSELDDETARSIVDCLAALQRETGMAAVIVEHNLTIATEIADVLLKVGSGGIEERMTPGQTAEPEGQKPEQERKRTHE